MQADDSRKSGRKLGQGMLFASFTLGLVALTLAFDAWLANEANPNRQPDFGETASGIRQVKLERNRQGHYIAGGSVNGVPATFLLDTGATDVAIPANLAEAAGLQSGQASRATTANGVVTVYTTSIDEIIIGNIVLQDVRASITPSMPGDTVLLGMSALRKVDFSQRGSILTLQQAPL